MSVELVQLIDAISHEKGIDRQILIEAIEAAVLTAARRRFDPEAELSVTFNASSGEAELSIHKEVVRTVNDPELEITLKDAKKINPEIKIGEKVKFPSKLENLGRIAALNGKQVILQRVREAEIDTIYNSYKDKINQIISGVVLRQERGDIIIDLGKIEGILPRKEQVQAEKFRRNDRVRAYVLDIRKSPKGVAVILSRTHPGLISRLFEMEVPEISEGIIEIKGVAREPSGRSKISVQSKEKDVDPVGACVGMRGVRVQSIVNELMGEKIDIVEWSDDPMGYVTNALSPAKISKVKLHPDERTMEVIVPDDQLSLAIGKRGQNVRLASNLIKWKIDIKGQNQMRQETEAQEFKQKDDEENLVGSLNAADEILEEDVKLLLNSGLNSFKKILKKGKEGLEQIGIGEEKIRVILEIAETNHKEDLEREKEATPAQRPFAVAKDSGKMPVEQPVQAPGQDEKSGEPSEMVENIEEFPIDTLPGVSVPLLEQLKAAGYKTVAEISGAEIDELVEDGLDIKDAEEILQKTAKFMELHEVA